MSEEFTVTWQKVQINSLPLPNQQTNNNIPGLFSDFQGLKFATFKYFQPLSRTQEYPEYILR